jgi:hypothetical protein
LFTRDFLIEGIRSTAAGQALDDKEVGDLRARAKSLLDGLAARRVRQPPTRRWPWSAASPISSTPPNVVSEKPTASHKALIQREWTVCN